MSKFSDYFSGLGKRFKENLDLQLALRIAPYVMMNTVKAMLRKEFREKANDPSRNAISRTLYKAGIGLTYVPAPRGF